MVLVYPGDIEEFIRQIIAISEAKETIVGRYKTYDEAIAYIAGSIGTLKALVAGLLSPAYSASILEYLEVEEDKLRQIARHVPL